MGKREGLGVTPGADEERFAAFYRTAYLPVLRFTVRRVSRERAEDLVSEAFIVAWRRFDDVPDEEHRAIAWTLAVVRNLLLNDGLKTVDSPPGGLARNGASPQDLGRLRPP
ncbi:MAG: hypothetical protein KBB39_01350 [Phycicoccus sp.]|nr:hypothetical protein [Phycicoccus sp.]